jgi:hypothetical protein
MVVHLDLIFVGGTGRRFGGIHKVRGFLNVKDGWSGGEG